MAIRHLTHIPSRIRDWYTDPYRHRSNAAEKLTVLLTLVLAVIGFLQWRVYRQQKAIMESSGQQTQKLIDAANIQAGAATKNAESASVSAKAASDLAGQTKSIAERALTQADATNDLASAARRSADVSQKIYVAAYTPYIANNIGITPTKNSDGVENGATIWVEIRNSGIVPATNFFADWDIRVNHVRLPSIEDASGRPSRLVPGQTATLTGHLDQERWLVVSRGKWSVTVKVFAKYKGAAGEQYTQCNDYTFFWDIGRFATFGDCVDDPNRPPKKP